MVYLFLVEKAVSFPLHGYPPEKGAQGTLALTDPPQHTVRNGRKSRLKSKLYCFNSFGMLSKYRTGLRNFQKIASREGLLTQCTAVYVVVAILNFVL